VLSRFFEGSDDLQLLTQWQYLDILWTVSCLILHTAVAQLLKLARSAMRSVHKSRVIALCSQVPCHCALFTSPVSF
jgi:hypothetical protein